MRRGVEESTERTVCTITIAESLQSEGNGSAVVDGEDLAATHSEMKGVGNADIDGTGEKYCSEPVDASIT